MAHVAAVKLVCCVHIGFWLCAHWGRSYSKVLYHEGTVGLAKLWHRCRCAVCGSTLVIYIAVGSLLWTC